MRTSEFDYSLPQIKIAKFPSRDVLQGKLLHLQPRFLRPAKIIDRKILDLPDLLNVGDALIVNDTKTLPALMQGLRESRLRGGNHREVLIHFNLLQPQQTKGFFQPFSNEWQILAMPSKRLQIDDFVWIATDFNFRLLEKLADGVIRVVFNKTGDSLMQAFEQYGKMPIPPYLKRRVQASDRDDYQTCFADKIGAVATPTAGLHFTPNFLAQLQNQKVKIIKVTLHVGAGTFLPVKTENMKDHKIHSEWGEISQQAADDINQTRSQGGKIIAVGTTSLRLLEWACQKLQSTHLEALKGNVDIFIHPGVPIRLCDQLMTNFHQPRSTLLALVAAFSGLENIRCAYHHALAHDYQFLSYGDACFLERLGR